jgi:NAD(P)-dependent dehydrogenase (short-subunit alcohol dehydrogenase family)
MTSSSDRHEARPGHDAESAGAGALAGPLFVTGAARGIGRAVAHAASRAGVPVARIDADGVGVARAARTALEPMTQCAEVLGLTCDVTDEDAVKRTFERAARMLGAPFGVVISAGLDRGGLPHEIAVADWDTVLNVSLRGTFLACREAVGHMLDAGGSIVCVSSPLAHVAPLGGAAAYCASKGAVCSLVRALAIDCAPHGIRVNALLPGATETPLMWAHVCAADVSGVRATVSREVPLGGWSTPPNPPAPPCGCSPTPPPT